MLILQIYHKSAALTKLLTHILRAHIVPENSTFENKAIQWFCDLLLNNDELNNIVGFDNGILVAYGMCPPCELLVPCNEGSLTQSSSDKPTYFMWYPSNDIWELADAWSNFPICYCYFYPKLVYSQRIYLIIVKQ